MTKLGKRDLLNVSFVPMHFKKELTAFFPSLYIYIYTRYEKMLTLSAEVQSKILQLLLKLTRSEWNGNQSRKYKEMYRSALIHASKSPSNATGSQFGDSFEIYSLLSLLKRQIGQC